LHEDAQSLLAHPLQRIKTVRRYWPGWLPAIALYLGHDEALPELIVDHQTGMPRDWGAQETQLRPMLEKYFRVMHQGADASLLQINQRYEREWLGRIVDRYASRGIPVIVFVVPRGPWAKELAKIPQAYGVVAELAGSGRLRALPGDAFVALEQPQYFFDALHMNRRGRERFSREFAQLVAPLVH
jgi:hypothetical protein